MIGEQIVLKRMVAPTSFMAVVMVVVVAEAIKVNAVMARPNYGDALAKSILFFEGQRSGKLPPNQRMTWRGDSALSDGFDKGVNLVGGYYDAGDNIKFHFPMAFSTTMLAWSVIEFRTSMGSELQQALDAIRWSTDYLLEATSIAGVVFAQVGNPFSDHNCWERPEDMDTSRTAYAVNKNSPGSEVSAEIAAALAASSMVFKTVDHRYSTVLLRRAIRVFKFADKYRGSYNDSTIGRWVCPFYCDYSGYQDELIWGAAWLHKVTKKRIYWDYVTQNINNLINPYYGGNFNQFGWDSKHAGINVLVSKFILNNSSVNSRPFLPLADQFVCSLLPESPSPSVHYSPGGLIYKTDVCNMQCTTALSFLLIVYARYLKLSNRVIQCENDVTTPLRLTTIAKGQVDYILGKNPMNMSYMVGYGEKFPQQIHHRASSLPSIKSYKQQIKCRDGSSFFLSNNSNPNLLVGAVVGGPNINDSFVDDRADAAHLEPTTYVNAPLVGLLAYFKRFDKSN